jgi:hypothetical protein
MQTEHHYHLLLTLLIQLNSGHMIYQHYKPLTTLPETCLDLDHELAYSSIAEAETSSLDILSIPCNTLRQSTDDGFEIECKKFNRGQRHI